MRTRARARMIARGNSVEENSAREMASRDDARAREGRAGGPGFVDVGSGEDNADRIAASAGGRGRWRRASGDARARGGCAGVVW